MSTPSHAVDVGKRIATDFSRKNVTFMAAGIAYNAFVSLAPLLILLLLVVSVVGGGLQDQVIAIATRSLPAPIADVVAQVFTETGAATSASLVGLVVLVWGTLKIFRGLDTAFSEIYETERRNSLVDQLLDGLVVLVALGVAALATVAASAAVAALSNAVPVIGYLAPVVLVAGLVVAFLPMYYRFPDTDLGWRDVLPGAVFAAIGWAALQAVFQVYLTFSGGGFGSFFGGVVVVVTWLYFSGLVLLLGAVINSVLGDHSSSSPGGVGRHTASAGGEPELYESMDAEELSTYLRDLRRRLTGYYEEVDAERVRTERRPVEDVETDELFGTLRTYRPLGDDSDEVEVIERSTRVGDEHERSVTVRWRRPEGESGE